MTRDQRYGGYRSGRNKTKLWMANPRLIYEEEDRLDPRILICRQCGKEFTFSTGEQEFYNQRGLSQPVRCRQCRSTRTSLNINS